MDAPAAAAHRAPVRVLLHIKKVEDALGNFLVRVTCPCGTSRHIEPEALAQRMRCSQRRKKVAEVVAVARPKTRGGRRR